MDSEDILNDALNFLGEQKVEDTEIVYGPLRLTMAPKEGKAITLLADHLFSPSIFLAERIERGLMKLDGLKVIELGAGCALPSLLMSTLHSPPSLIIITDYPDSDIIHNLQCNITRNRAHFSQTCRVECHGYEWGADLSSLLALSGNTGFDAVVLSDLLHFDSSHAVLVASLCSLLSKAANSIAYVAAGKYTHPYVCDAFFRHATDAGLVFEEIIPNEDEKKWQGVMTVPSFDAEALFVRKDACRFWIGRWAQEIDASKNWNVVHTEEETII